MNCEYVQNYYNVPACIGRNITFKGRPGIISEDRGNYIGVNFNSDKHGIIFNLHPTFEVEYKDMRKIRKINRSKKRYQDYLDSEYPGSFTEYIGIKRSYSKEI